MMSSDENKDNDNYKEIGSIVNVVSIIAAMMTGLILGLLRIREPYFKFLLKQ